MLLSDYYVVAVSYLSLDKSHGLDLFPSVF